MLLERSLAMSENILATNCAYLHQRVVQCYLGIRVCTLAGKCETIFVRFTGIVTNRALAQLTWTLCVDNPLTRVGLSGGHGHLQVPCPTNQMRFYTELELPWVLISARQLSARLAGSENVRNNSNCLFLCREALSVFMSIRQCLDPLFMRDV